jgi:hypothetical protein
MILYTGRWAAGGVDSINDNCFNIKNGLENGFLNAKQTFYWCTGDAGEAASVYPMVQTAGCW